MHRLSNLAIATKLALVFASLILIVAAVGISTYVNLGFIEQNSNWTARTYQVLETAEAVMASMVNQETGVRGYLVAEDPKFLEPYRAGRQAYDSDLARLKQLTADNARQQERLEALNRSAMTWRDEVAEREIALMAAPETRQQARSMEANGAGKSAMDALRAQVAEEVSGIVTGIASAVEEQGAATAEIARNVQQTATSTQQVTSNIATVSQAAGSTGAAAGQVLGAARNLSHQGGQLTGEVNGFVAGMRAA